MPAMSIGRKRPEDFLWNHKALSAFYFQHRFTRDFLADADCQGRSPGRHLTGKPCVYLAGGRAAETGEQAPGGRLCRWFQIEHAQLPASQGRRNIIKIRIVRQALEPEADHRPLASVQLSGLPGGNTPKSAEFGNGLPMRISFKS